MNKGGNEPLDLDAIEERANAATPGPWAAVGLMDTQGVRGIQGPKGASEFSSAAGVWANGFRVEDAVFIASSRTDIPALVVEVGRLQMRVAADTPLVRLGAAYLEWVRAFEAWNEAGEGEEDAASLREAHAHRIYVEALEAVEGAALGG